MGYFKTYQLKELMHLSRSWKPSSYRLVISVILDIPLQSVDVKQSRQITKSTSEQTNEVYYNGELKAILHADFPILLQLDWPCQYTEKWRKRKRLWPALHMVSEELNVSYLIAKTSREEKENRNSIEFKYSFLHIEQKIMRLLSQNQRTVFYTAKTLFKLYVKPLSEVYLPSFLVKNTLLWICEQTPPDHLLWDFKSEESFLNVLRYLFERLTRQVKANFAPYYFISQVNLIEGIPEEISRNVLETLERLTLNIKSHLLDNESRGIVESWLDLLARILYRAEDTSEAIKRLGTFLGLLTTKKYAITNIKEYIKTIKGNHYRLKEILLENN